MRMCHFWVQNVPFVLDKFFLGKNDYYFRLFVGPFQCEKFLKILTADPELGKCAILGPKMVLKWYMAKN